MMKDSDKEIQNDRRMDSNVWMDSKKSKKAKSIRKKRTPLG